MEAAHGVQVVTVEEDHTYHLNEAELEKILTNENIKDLRVALVSVAGAYRGGKSFLLNFFIRYLSAPVRCKLKSRCILSPLSYVRQASRRFFYILCESSLKGRRRTRRVFVLNLFCLACTSCLLSFILCAVNNADVTFQPSARTDGTWLSDESKELTGFIWQGGSVRITTGITIWSEPFVITLPSGEKVSHSFPFF